MSARLRWTAVVAAVAAWPAAALAAAPSTAGRVYRQTRHGDPATGVLRLPSAPRGACAHCHDPRTASGKREKVRCEACHSGPGKQGIYPGAAAYARSDHASSWAIWPETERGRRREGGDCVNCHDPHGHGDALGLVPALARRREEALCLECHDGSPAKDVRAQPSQPYAHPWSATSGTHAAAEGALQSSAAGAARHAECVDCHNPHVVRRGSGRAEPPEAPAALQGVARVRVTNGAAGAIPAYTYAPPDDSSVVLEYEVCFRCHSSFAPLRASSADLAIAFNPANASFHPVEAPGRNARIAAGAFVRGWSAERMVRCSDCHTSDTGVRGPHASSHRYLLAGAYSAEQGRVATSASDLCFRCHDYGTYAASGASPSALAQSRFNPPNAPAGHAFHVVTQGLGCHTCHESHGSPNAPNLIAVGRVPGISSFSHAEGGGTCATMCHQRRTYGINYPR